MYVKVCGITSPADARSAVAAGADAIGVILFTPSSRAVTPRRAETILSAVRGEVETVCVTTTRSPAALRRLYRLNPDAVQIYHGQRVPDRFTCIAAWDGLSNPPEDADRLLLDASHGRGIPLDLPAAEAAMCRTGHPIIVSGGLHPATVALVIQQLDPAGVDVSSGIELRPGVKDMQLMKHFVTACRMGAV
ncbi:MAG: phosphoribosylanthranilate isomerase [Methanocalculus sp. MSAO_Arc1]|uniref:phosphoribosylanthranilate isomerase n=1 Tax=Methanocalculus TaxID=71151 RepID=UPI000FED6937|nr:MULTISPECIES: phosphoribosylanthranilate isomerase [unclassified Methanocalculus]MCP1661671.1 phosphoribosylanthranilate isomerase [Methanocalculus sp. AMF5]RQD81415.1 MAG: phosphoribosylanthranilate isomerase [Methanocalculus sp. MSAO_Arc1]